MSVLSKAVIDRSEFNSGCHKLPLGKVDSRLLRISINNPVADGFALHDSLWGTGKQVLYPSQDSLGFTNTQTTVKDLQWFVRNPTSTIEVNSIVVADDNQAAFWSTNNWGTGTLNLVISNESTIKTDGTDSLKLIWSATGGSYSGIAIYHTYASPQNWSAKDFIAFRLYGCNTGNTMQLQLNCDAGGIDNSDAYLMTLTDNFVGWKRFVLLFSSFTVQNSPSLSNIKSVALKRLTTYSNATFYLDRVIVDVCPSIPVKKLSINGLYLENQKEESGNAVAITDDNQAAFWTADTGANPAGTIGVPTLANDTSTKIKGSDCLSITSTVGSYGQWRIFHNYGSPQDYSAKDFYCLYLYGTNSGKNFIIMVTSDVIVTGNVETNFRYWVVVDNWGGWKRLILAFTNATADVGSPNLSSISGLSIRSSISQLNWAYTGYLDRVIVDVGSWAKVEVAVPDILYQYANCASYNALVADWSYWLLSFWYSSSYANGTVFGGPGANAGIYYYSGSSKFLDGSTLKSLYGDSQTYWADKSLTMLMLGFKGQTKSRSFSTAFADQSITYNGLGGCKRRIGFGVKMPPADGLASSTTGISQAKLKLEVYVP